MKIRTLLILLVLIFFAKFSIAQEGILFSDGSLNAILSIAKDRNKNVFIDTYADWCVPCKRMDKKFKDRDVAIFFNEHFINYKVNMQNTVKANQLRKRYDIVFLPTMLIVDPNGIVKYQVDRELTTSELLNMAQQSLDPTSYHVSESTAVRRNSNEIVVAQKPKSQLGNKPVEKTTRVQKSNNTGTSSPSLSEATRRAKLLDSYETVDESSQKVLAVLGVGELPPEILLQEAYLRLEFMDGSHKTAAKNYLATQKNWDTEINRKFILDFVNNVSSLEYKFIVKNKEKFNKQFGNQNVQKTLEILTYRALHNAVPRPTLEEAIHLYINLEVPEPIRQGNNYYISRLITEDNIEEVTLSGNRYLETAPNDHEILYLISRYLANREDGSVINLDLAKTYMEAAITLSPKSLIYLDQLGSIYIKQGNDKKAHRTFSKAIKEAKKQGKDSKYFEEKILALNGQP